MAVRVRAGEHRNRIEVQERLDARGADGGVAPAWSTVTTKWAAVIPLSGRELVNAQLVDSRARIQVEMRSHAGLDQSHRLVMDNRVLNIVSIVDVDTRGIRQIVLCEEATSGTADPPR